MCPGRQQGAARPRAAFAALLLFAAGLAACSGFAAPNEEPPAALDLAYRPAAADYLRSQFKDYASYDSYEISEPQWVHSVRLELPDLRSLPRPRSPAQLRDAIGKVIDGRYAVGTDGCDTQAYAPFELVTGGGLQPLH